MGALDSKYSDKQTAQAAGAPVIAPPPAPPVAAAVAAANVNPAKQTPRPAPSAGLLPPGASNYVGTGPTDPDTNARPNHPPVDAQDVVARIYNEMVGKPAQAGLQALPDYNPNGGANLLADEGRMGRALGMNVFAPPPAAPAIGNEGRATRADISVPAPAPAVGNEGRVTRADISIPTPATAASRAPAQGETGPRAFTMPNGQRMVTNVDGNANAMAGMQAPSTVQPVLQDVGAAGVPFGGSAAQQLANIRALREPEPQAQQFQPERESEQDKENAEKTYRWAMEDIVKSGKGGRLQAAMAAAQIQAMTARRNAELQAQTAAEGHRVQARGQDVSANTALTTTGMNNATSRDVTGMNNATSRAVTGMNNATSRAVTGMNNATSRDVAGMQTLSAQQIASMNNAAHLDAARLHAEAQAKAEESRAATARDVARMGAHPIAGAMPGTGYHWNDQTKQWVLVTQPMQKQ